MKIRIGMAAFALSFLSAVPTFAATLPVAVVFHENTEVNHEAYNFLKRAMSQLDPEIRIVPVSNPTRVKPGRYKAVVVLNSGRTAGWDPDLQTFVSQYAAKNELYVVTLQKGSKSLIVQKSVVPSPVVGVDGVTAASRWSEGADKMTYIRVHQEWIRDLDQFIRGRN